MKEARERLDAIEAQEVLAEPPVSQNPKLTLIFWIVLIVVGLAIYVGTAWLQRH